jgi:uncharacterized protein with PhoU and TrkA domain
VRNITTNNIVSVYPDESVDVALQRMAPRDLSRLPVVAREDLHRLLGEVRRNDIVHAYEVGALRREEARYRGEQNSVVHGARVQFVEVLLPPDSYVVHKHVAEISLPRGVVLVSIRRGRDMLIPHGDTQLMPGDVVTALCERDCAEEFVATLKNGKNVKS